MGLTTKESLQTVIKLIMSVTLPRGCSASWWGSSSESISATVAASTSRTPGVLYDYTVAIETTTVELIDRVLGVACIFKLHESVTLFDDHIANATVT